MRLQKGTPQILKCFLNYKTAFLNVGSYQHSTSAETILLFKEFYRQTETHQTVKPQLRLMTELGDVVTVHAFVNTRIRVVQELKLFENIFVILQATFDPRSLVVVLVWP